MTIAVQRADDRFHTDIDWLDSKHSFNFGSHYREGEQRPRPAARQQRRQGGAGGGFGTHGHRDMEIVTWVLVGQVGHHDSEGNTACCTPASPSACRRGRGIRHSEMNASDTEPVHFVQMWVLPDTAGVDPGYEQRDINEALATGAIRTQRRRRTVPRIAATMIGFITLFGIATRNGIMLVSHIQHLINEEGVTDFREAVERGARERLIPILMTALAAGLALIPLALGGGKSGSEIQTPMAIVILCGLASSTFLNMVVVPTLYLRYGALKGADR